ncbi:MAG TPA: acetate--CoA ligase family protein [Candidatus Paceibacterota bacterium]|nr:acetate--CoA ligase family protein [Candidatus Paceibacterota bacterium]
MRILTEKEAEEFLEKEGFEVVERKHIEKESEIKKAIDNLGFPIVLKVSGEKIIHKNKLGGIKTNIENYGEALKAFIEIKKINYFEGAMIQKQIKGKEFLLGIKKTPEFGHVIAFGAGGIFTEKLKDISFRVCSFDKTEARKMIREIEMAKNLTNKNVEIIEKNLIKLCHLVKKYPKIKELDINPLIVNQNKAIIVDARIVFE